MADTVVETEVEQPKAEAAVEAPKIPTLAETEAQWRQQRATELGPKFAERFPETKPVEVKKEEPKTEEKKEEPKAEEKKEEPKVEPKPKSGFGRQIRRAVERSTEPLNATIAQLQAEIATLKGGTEKKDAPAPLVEPQQKDFPDVKDYIAAVRLYDKAVAEQDKVTAVAQREADKATNEWNAKVEKYNAEVKAVEKKYPDWAQKRDSADVTIGRAKDAEYNTLMAGVLMEAGPETIYQLVSKPSEARQLSKLDSTGLIAASNADDVSSVLLWLASHPEDIRVLNGMSPVKAQGHVGKIEAKIELAKAAPTKVELKADTKESPSSGDSATQPKAEAKAEKGAAATEDEGPKKPKSDPPPALKGSAPSKSDWREPASMTLAERERLYMEDPKNKRR